MVEVPYDVVAKVREHGARVFRAAGYDLPMGTPVVFERVRSWLTNDAHLTPRIALLFSRVTPEKPSHYGRLKDGAWPVGNVHSALMRTRYHRDRVEEIEDALRRCVDPALLPILRTSVVAGGNTLRLDFEYQAFIIAARTVLDYLARTVSAYFGQESHSFADLPKNLLRFKPTSVAPKLCETVVPLHEGLSHFYGTSDAISVRDDIAHRYFVRAAHLNVRSDGVVLFGGGEGLGIQDGLPLVAVLDGYLERLMAACTETLGRLIDLDAAYDPASEPVPTPPTTR
jgi:hypothetical protein